MLSSGTLTPVVPLLRVAPDPLGPSGGSGGNWSCVPVARHSSLGPPKALQWVAPPEVAAWPVNCGGREALCEVLRKTAVRREVMVAVANSAAPGLQSFLESVKALNISNFMVVAIDKALAERLAAQGVPYYFSPNAAQGNHKVSAQKFSLLRTFVAVGCSVLLTDTDVVYLQNPFPFLYRDADVESMSDGWDASTAFGWLDPLDDVTMGNGSPLRRAHTLRAAALNSGLWFVQATSPVLALMTVMEHRMATEDLWDQAGYNMELFLPTHDQHSGARAHVRVMAPLCFVNSKVLFRHIRFQQQLASFRPVAIHVNYHADKQHKMDLAVERYLRGNAAALDACIGDGCARGMANVTVLEAGAQAGVNDGFAGGRAVMKAVSDVTTHGCSLRRPWDDKLDPQVTYPLAGRLPKPATPMACPSGALELCTALAAAVAAGGAADHPEVLLVVCDSASAPHIGPLLMSLSQLKLGSRTVVVTLDDTARDTVAGSEGGGAVQLVYLSPGAPLRQDASGGPLGVGAVKWRCLAETLRAGVSVLAVDPDTVLLDDLFPVLYRDADVEAAPDGWDETSVWGYDHVVDDPSMGWSRYCHGTRMATRDPGLLWLAATQGAVALAERLAARLAAPLPGQPSEREAFNQETWLPSALEYVSVGASLRVMNFLCAANSKVVATLLLTNPSLRRSGFTPLAVRATYTRVAHKAAFLGAVLEQYGPRKRRGAVEAALKAAKGSSEGQHPGCASPAAQLHPLTREEGAASSLAQWVTRQSNWSWAGVTPFTFLPAGDLSTPWGRGTWGLVPQPAGEAASALFADFAGTHTVLQFEPLDGQPFGAWPIFHGARTAFRLMAVCSVADCAAIALPCPRDVCLHQMRRRGRGHRAPGAAVTVDETHRRRLV